MADRILQPLKAADSSAPDACYHCDEKGKQLRLCEMWRVWSCPLCMDKLHRPHHQTCERIVPRGGAAPEVVQEARYFTIVLTRYDGRGCSLLCRLGEKLVMEDHWMGTYIFAAAGMMLVLENRETINARILDGLADVQ